MGKRKTPFRRFALIGLSGLLLTASATIAAEQIYMEAKKRVASTLIRDAYARHLDDGRFHRPWSWADFYPLARLCWIGDDGKEREGRIVLSGASGPSLAFGVGHIDGTSAPLASGNCVLAGHRTAEFRFLRHLQVGDKLRLSGRSEERSYIVAGLEVVSYDDVRPVEAGGRDRLTLITCYPFDGLRTSKERYVVYCRPVEPVRAGGSTAVASDEVRVGA